MGEVSCRNDQLHVFALHSHPKRAFYDQFAHVVFARASRPMEGESEGLPRIRDVAPQVFKDRPVDQMLSMDLVVKCGAQSWLCKCIVVKST